jgi:hypothetical protein
MTATTRNSTLYTNRDVLNEGGSGIAQVYDAYQMGGRLFKIEMKHTIISAEASGDSTNLCVIPHGARVTGVRLVTDGLAASTGGCTVKLQATDDAGTVTDLTAATSMGVTGNQIANLSFAGMNYTPAVGKAVVSALYAVADPTDAHHLDGHLEVMLPS